jgi:hypothetical protein
VPVPAGLEGAVGGHSGPGARLSRHPSPYPHLIRRCSRAGSPDDVAELHPTTRAFVRG